MSSGGWPSIVLRAIKSGPVPRRRDWRSLPTRELTRGERVCKFIEDYCIVPEGVLLGQPLKLIPSQEAFILAVYDNPTRTRRAYLSTARKNAKTGTIACLLLAHVVGPEAIENSRITSGALSRKQAAEVYNYAAKMVRMSPRLSKVARLVHSSKVIVGLAMNVEYQAISAEAKTAHGGSPVVAIMDETGQVRGPYDAFVEAIETSQGAYEGKSIFFAISTQAATDADLFSIWLDDAAAGHDPSIVSHVYEADAECSLADEKQWKYANPGLGVFLSREHIQGEAAKAERMPTSENSFRWLHLNQRISALASFISRSVWEDCGEPVAESFTGPVYGAIDLSSVADLTAKVYVSKVDGIWHVKSEFWLPGEGLNEKSVADRVPYDVWRDQGFLKTAPGKTIQYEFVAEKIFRDVQEMDVRKIAFDRWNWPHFKPWLLKAGFREDQLEGDDALFQPFGQGYQSMSPALRDLESDLLERKIAHGKQPVLTMCAANAIVTTDPAGNRKLDKGKATGRIDGMVALAMAHSVASTHESKEQSVYRTRGALVL